MINIIPIVNSIFNQPQEYYVCLLFSDGNIQQGSPTPRPWPKIGCGLFRTRPHKRWALSVQLHLCEWQVLMCMVASYIEPSPLLHPICQAAKMEWLGTADIKIHTHKHTDIHRKQYYGRWHGKPLREYTTSSQLIKVINMEDQCCPNCPYPDQKPWMK